MHRHEQDTLLDRWKRAERFIATVLNEKEKSKIQILAYSMGCHLAVKTAMEIKRQGRHTLDAIFHIVPDPKYRACEEDHIDKIKKTASAYEEACDLWEISRAGDQGSPGERFEQGLGSLAQVRNPVEIHFVSSPLDTLAEWQGNTKRLHEATQSLPYVHWWFPDDEPTIRPRRYKLQPLLDPLQAESLGEIWVHVSLDCEITPSE